MHTLFIAIRTKLGTLRTTFTAGGANRVHTIFAFIAGNTVISVAADTVKANTALTAQFIICAIRAFFSAFGTDVIGTFRTALAADTDVGHAIFALVAVIAVIALTADTVVTDPAGTADPVGTVFALLIAFRTDQRTL